MTWPPSSLWIVLASMSWAVNAFGVILLVRHSVSGILYFYHRLRLNDLHRNGSILQFGFKGHCPGY